MGFCVVPLMIESIVDSRQFKGLTANAADPQAQARDIGLMLMLMQRLICMSPCSA